MFEGQFTVQIVGADGKIIVQAPVKEVYAGSWTKGSPVSFESKIEFATEQKTGTLVFKHANPSGLPENEKSYTVSVNFAKKDFQALLKDGCVKEDGANQNYYLDTKLLPFKLEGNNNKAFCLSKSEIGKDSYLYIVDKEVYVYDDASDTTFHRHYNIDFVGDKFYDDGNYFAYVQSELYSVNAPRFMYLPIESMRFVVEIGRVFAPHEYEDLYFKDSILIDVFVNPDLDKIIDKHKTLQTDFNKEFISEENIPLFYKDLTNSLFFEKQLSEEYKMKIDDLTERLQNIKASSN